MIVLALDIATQMGIAVGKAGGDPHAWSVDLGKGRSHDARFSKILAETSMLMAKYKPDAVAIEAPIGGPKTSHLLVGLAACARGCCANRGVDPKPYDLKEVRKSFMGFVPAKKDYPGLSDNKATLAIKSEVMRHCRLRGWHVDDHDAADACAVWELACAKAGFQIKVSGEMFNA